MKTVKFWSIILLTMMSFPVMVSCSSDDESNDGSAAAYTESEVKDILQGKWEVSGIVSASYSSTNHGTDISESYTGTVEFINNQFKYRYEPANAGITEYIRTYLCYPYYELLKKSGKYYIDISGNYYYLEILSLSKNSFKMALDEDIKKGGKVIGHIHITMISK